MNGHFSLTSDDEWREKGEVVSFRNNHLHLHLHGPSPSAAAAFSIIAFATAVVAVAAAGVLKETLSMSKHEDHELPLPSSVRP